jgi:hypothetical protein
LAFIGPDQERDIFPSLHPVPLLSFLALEGARPDGAQYQWGAIRQFQKQDHDLGPDQKVGRKVGAL